MTTWNLDAARRLYGIQHWGNGYFNINEAGHVVMHLPNEPERFVDVFNLVNRLKNDGLRWPMLIRFTDIVHDRVQRLQKAFNQAIQSTGQSSRYTAIYPIKVNQQKSVIQHILAGGGEQVGLEAGSKPELVAVLGSAPTGSTIICNGYKDREYLRLALIGRQMGHRIFIVVEKPSELTETLEESAKLGIDPLFGIRVRLYSLGKGKWQNTGGEKSKFGLSAAQALTMLETLKQANKLDCLRLLHFHMGSQIANIRDIQSGMLEASHYFAELNRLGARIRVVDVGGGLGVDYEGSRSRSDCSINYTMQEYANTIVRSVHSVCVEYDLPLPDFLTEAGRAMTAHHAVLVTNVIDTDPAQPEVPPQVLEPQTEAPQVLHNLYRLHTQLHQIPASEIYHDAEFLIGEVHALYARGVIDLKQRAQAEDTYRAIGLELLNNPQLSTALSSAIHSALQEKLANKYFCNFSLFQSMPDSWAIKQIFPIMPLHRLDEVPTRRAVLQDLTCDSDGAVHTYVENGQLTSTLAVHELSETDPYLMGIFMVGAYQEILGDLHNLFGDTDSINVELLSNGEYRLQEPESGDSIDELLRVVHFEPKELLAQCRKKLAATVHDAEQLKALQREIEASLTDYTYLED